MQYYAIKETGSLGIEYYLEINCALIALILQNNCEGSKTLNSEPPR